MNFIVKFSGISPDSEVASYTCFWIISCSCFSSLSMKSWLSSRITVTKGPVADWFIRFLNSIFWLIKSTAALAFLSKLGLNFRDLTYCPPPLSLWVSYSCAPRLLYPLSLFPDLLKSFWNIVLLERISRLLLDVFWIFHLSSSLNVLFLPSPPSGAFTCDLCCDWACSVI